jgi:predicted ester cyclase
MVVVEMARACKLGKQVGKVDFFMLEENKSLAHRPWEPVSQHNPDALEEVYAANLVGHEPDQDVQDVEEAKQYYSTLPSAFPDLSFTVEDVIAEGDEVATRWTVPGMKRMAVYVLAVLALCGLAVTLALLLAPDISWAAVLNWLTTSSSGPCPFVG